MDAWLSTGDGSTLQQSVGASSRTQFPTSDRMNDPSPLIPDCSSHYDFTLLFEERVLSIVPSTCFIVLAALRVLYLRNRKNAITGNRGLKSSKLAAISILAIVDIAIFLTIAQQDTSLALTKIRLASAVLTFIATIFVGFVSYFEHVRATRPSILLSAYLLINMVVGILRARTAWLTFGRVYAIIFTTSTVLTGLVAILEALPKRKWGSIALDDKSPEESSGLYDIAFLAWLNPLIRLGNRQILDTDDLYPIDTRLSASTVSEQFRQSWTESSSSRSLKRVLVKTLLWSILQPIPSKLASVAFSFCQPFFIQGLVRYLESDPVQDCNTGPRLILACICIYTGLALSSASFAYLNTRWLAKLRSCLVIAMFDKTVELKATHLDTEVLTLMSTDVDRIQYGLQSLHDIWANIGEATLACWLLQRELGAAFAAPVAIILTCALATTGVSRFAGPRMVSWTKLTEGRVKLTNAIVSNVKPLKMSGLAGSAAAMLQQFRTDEIRAGTGFRVIMLFSVFNAFIPEFISPLATFTIVGRQLSLAEVFGSLSYLTLLTAPLSQLFQKVPMILACMGSLKRIQDFLDKDKDEDYRVFEQSTLPSDGDSTAISIQDLKVGWIEGKWQLSGLNCAIPKAQITVITGPVACGKSTLCKALLGEATFIDGLIKFHQEQPRIGYCEQTPFLVNGSIRSNIIGFEPFDGALYDEILEAVMLKSDLRTLPMADETQVGSSGVTLSGGQKQRVALARALYLKTSTYVLDDFTVGLDKPTADEVVKRLFRDDGFLVRRKATVVWCTHSVQYLHLAKHIIAISADGGILHQGSPDEVLKDRQVTLALEHDEKQNGGGDIGSDLKLSDASPPKPPSDKSASRALTEASVYTHYFSSFGSLLLIASICAATTVGFSTNAGSIWLKFWADNSFAIPGPIHQVNAFYLGIYACIQIMALVSLVVHVGLIVVGMARASGTTLHLRAVLHLMNAPLRYLTKTDQGVIVNYFSQDMNMVDMTLPSMLMNTSALAVIALGQATVIAIGTPVILFAYPVFLIVMYRLTKYYLATSRQLRLLELENKSPLYTQFADTVRGLASIRAFGWIQPYTAQNHRLLDDSQRPLYLLAMLGTWLSLVLKFIVASIAVTVTVLVTQVASLRDRAGFVAAGFLALMQFSGFLNTVVQCWVQLEMSLGAVKRLKEFGEAAGSEDRVGEDLRPGEQWPERGEIVIDAVDASYAEERFKDDPEEMGLALKGVSMKVSAGEKVAIVGRTGSGKSSLILLLLRLLDPTVATENNITIDGLPLRRIHRDTLRQRVIAMPQDMVFLAAGETFKAALDPYAHASDDECQVALGEVGLLDTVKEAGGLHALIAKDTLSQGQKQLFSLAIAVLRARVREQAGALGGVLLLDEVTSNVDRETEKTIMGVIDRVFKEYSVLAVTHSLESVVSFDKVFVMAEGHVVKEGDPNSLIKDGEGTN